MERGFGRVSNINVRERGGVAIQRTEGGVGPCLGKGSKSLKRASGGLGIDPRVVCAASVLFITTVTSAYSEHFSFHSKCLLRVREKFPVETGEFGVFSSLLTRVQK